jgi:hypothetical protein
MHAVVPAQPELGLQPGVIFALKNINDSVNVNQQNRLHPFYLVYIDDDGQIPAMQTPRSGLLIAYFETEWMPGDHLARAAAGSARSWLACMSKCSGG